MMLARRKKYNVILAILVATAVLLLAAVVFYFLKNTGKASDNILNQPVAEEAAGSTSSTEQEILSEPIEPLPSKHLLAVPFQSQAPYRNWAEPYQNACEEALIIMVKYFYQGAALDGATMKSEIDKSVDWEIKTWGGHFDLNATETLKLADQYFGLQGEVVTDYTLDSIKRDIFDGKPVIVPSAGRLLGNPGFTVPGPIYHMLVLIGYDDSRGVFITNDPGVNHGANFKYKYQTIMDAVSGPKANMAKELLILDK